MLLCVSLSGQSPGHDRLAVGGNADFFAWLSYNAGFISTQPPRHDGSADRRKTIVFKVW